MDAVKKYWQIIIMAIGIVSSATAAQVQIGTNADNIDEIKKDIVKLDDQKTEQAVMKSNQEHMKETLKEIKQLIREMKK